MLKKEEINIRDPFVLLVEGKYYMTGTAGADAWTGGSYFPVYISDDLENWEGPVRAFVSPEGFWATDNFWAPEIHPYKGAYYMFASFHNPEKNRASQIMRAEKPEGPYEVWSSPITPDDWYSLDATFYVDEAGQPWTVFCHEWTQIGTGEICAVKLTDDLRGTVGEPITLFAASEAPWVTPNEEKLIAGKKCMVTDGPFLVKDEGGLTMFWSSFSNGNYAEGMAVSESGSVLGPWKQIAEPLFEKDGGHGMLFKTKEGKLMFSLHRPNLNPMERPCFFELKREDGRYKIV
ncbi:MAG: glycoside hydrolase family 43 protein [Clostridia bacterium]|nr:glycoside hydrolase family 43 protein [Clostridia bacterium]